MINSNTINNVLQACIDAGGDFAEIFIEDKQNTQISMMANIVENGITAREFGIGIRVMYQNNYVYTYTSDPREETLIKAVRNICRREGVGNKNAFLPQKIISDFSKAVIKPFNTVNYNNKLDVVKKVSNSGYAYNPLINKMFVKYLDQVQNVVIANSEGLYAEDKRVKSRVLTTASAQKGNIMQTGYVGPGAAKGFEFYEDIDLEYYGREAARSAVDMLDAKYCPSGQMSVVVDNGFGGLLFHEACGHSLESSVVGKGNSEFAGRLGQKVASDIITLIDDGSISNQWGSSNIDDEGTTTRKNTLIENGILKSYLVDRLGARRMGIVSNGSGRRESYKFAPTSRMSNTYIDTGKSTPKEIVENTEKGLFVKAIHAGSVNPVTGEFNFSIAESYLIKDGKIGIPVKCATLIGKGGDVLQNVDMVGNNLALGQGYCYAGSGALFISAGQPMVRVSSMTVGGIEK